MTSPPDDDRVVESDDAAPATGGQTAPSGSQTPPGGTRPEPRTAEQTDSEFADQPSAPRTSPTRGQTGPDGGGLDSPEGVSDQRAAEIREDVASQSDAVYPADVTFDERGRDGRVDVEVSEDARDRVAEQRIADRYEGVESEGVRVDRSAERPDAEVLRGEDRVDVAAQETEYSQRELQPTESGVERTDVALRSQAAERSPYAPGDLRVVEEGNDRSVVPSIEAQRDQAEQNVMAETDLESGDFTVQPTTKPSLQEDAGAEVVSSVGVQRTPETVGFDVRLEDDALLERAAEQNDQFSADELAIEYDNGERQVVAADQGGGRSPLGDVLGGATDVVTENVDISAEDYGTSVGFAFGGPVGAYAGRELGDAAGDAEASGQITNPESPLRRELQGVGESIQPYVDAGVEASMAPYTLPAEAAEEAGLPGADATVGVNERVEAGAAQALNPAFIADDAVATGQAGAYIAGEGDISGIPDRAGTVAETGVVLGEEAGEYAIENPERTAGAVLGGAAAGTAGYAATRGGVRAARSASPAPSGTAARIRAGAGEVRSRSPVGVEIDPEAPMIDVADDLPERVSASARDTATAPWRATKDSLGTFGDYLGDQARATRMQQVEARQQRLEGVGTDESLIDPSPGETYAQIRDSADLSVRRARRSADDVITDARLTLADRRARIGDVDPDLPGPSLEGLRDRIPDVAEDSPLLGDTPPRTINVRMFESDRPGLIERGGQGFEDLHGDLAESSFREGLGTTRDAITSRAPGLPRTGLSDLSDVTIRIGSRPERPPAIGLGDLEEGTLPRYGIRSTPDSVPITPRSSPARRFSDDAADGAGQAVIQDVDELRRVEPETSSTVGTGRSYAPAAVTGGLAGFGRPGEAGPGETGVPPADPRSPGLGGVITDRLDDIGGGQFGPAGPDDIGVTEPELGQPSGELEQVGTEVGVGDRSRNRGGEVAGTLPAVGTDTGTGTELTPGINEGVGVDETTRVAQPAPSDPGGRRPRVPAFDFPDTFDLEDPAGDGSDELDLFRNPIAGAGEVLGTVGIGGGTASPSDADTAPSDGLFDGLGGR